MLKLTQHAVVIPIQKVPGIGIERAVQIAVTVLCIAVARQDLKRQPIDQVLGIKVGVEHVIDLLRFVVERIEHLDELGVVRVALNLEHGLKVGLVVVGFVGEFNGVLVAIELKVVHLVQVSILI